MSNSFDSYQKRRLQSSYISVVISIALVLFMLGILGLVLLKSTSVSNRFKEKIAITLFLKNGITKKNIDSLRTSLSKENFTKKILYISKKQAAKTLTKDIGEDFVKFLGTNPLKNEIDIYLKADFVTLKKMTFLEKKFRKNSFIVDVFYDKPLIKLLTENIQRIGFWLLILSTFFGFVAMILINSSIRLSVYSKRFNIKTMQMVGATKKFIRKPFIWRSVRLGMLGALIAILGLGFIIFYIDKRVPSLALLQDYITLGYLAGGILIIAFIITWISTFFATQRFLNLQTNELYY